MLNSQKKFEWHVSRLQVDFFIKKQSVKEYYRKKVHGSPAPRAISSIIMGQSEQALLLDAPKFDLEAYIANYSGRTRYERLFLIGSTSSFLCVEAIKGALGEAKQGKDILRYQRAVSLLHHHQRDDPEARPDVEWVDGISKQVKAEIDRLEHELKGYKNNLIKESIRMGHEDFGNYYHEIGDLPSAYKFYAKMREYCTSNKQILEMCLKMLVVGVEQCNWISVQTTALKIRDLTLKPELEAEVRPKLFASVALSYLATGNYKEAASSFLMVDFSLGDSFNQVMTSNDIAVYGGLCALASMGRTELQLRVLENASFRNFLELEPHIRRAIGYFCNLKYRDCLETLEAYRTDYLLDIHLRRHLQEIYSLIRIKSIVQSFTPCRSAPIAQMAQDFSSNEDSMQEELVDLIQRDILEARIDTQKKLVTAYVRNARGRVISESLQMAKVYEKVARHRLFAINAINAGLEIRAIKGSNQSSYGAAGDIVSSGQYSYKNFRSGRFG
ncbi:MAG: hypothetical protein M1812_000101 [Candelaria pacifica]|nr:MAG: hypothetical protein M1812_000101 [Candelaria pacifica]